MFKLVDELDLHLFKFVLDNSKVAEKKTCFLHLWSQHFTLKYVFITHYTAAGEIPLYRCIYKHLICPLVFVCVRENLFLIYS